MYVRGKKLYIPHGSDNTWNLFEWDSCPNCFISHMVQIIQTIRKQLFLPLVGLYIPHGSDNTLRVEMYDGLTYIALYPTWFR